MLKTHVRKEKGRKFTPGQIPNTGQRKERLSVLVINPGGHGIMGKIWVGKAYSSRNLAPPRRKKGNHDYTHYIIIPPPRCLPPQAFSLGFILLQLSEMVPP